MCNEEQPFFSLADPGNLYLDETFIFYDGPIVFTCREENNKLYLVVAAEVDRRHQSWVMGEITEDTLLKLSASKQSVYDALKNSPNLWFIDYDIASKLETSRHKLFEEIPDKLLPDVDSFLYQTAAEGFTTC